MLTDTNWLTRLGVGSVVALGALSFTGCTTDGEEVEDIVESAEEIEEEVEDQGEEATEEGFEGPYDQNFYDDIETLDGQTVSLSATVGQVISDNAFTILGSDDLTTEELLVIHEGMTPALETDDTVLVMGTARNTFILEEVEEGGTWDLDPGVFAEWETLPYIEADSVQLDPAEAE
ncbi:hypothetical protein OH146_02065 [Salinibacterium sp. SYSU T00001]|uniref:hypothetical protein n=1 Tax=Homoserinimonas sedimenticola TaxID=2986805 RepID=UPI0022355822|nr:hypothetical protein [Salinibacterium sedimenticola]MCW4384554.1 hypothetical protein [Salinibacterium sedimenticola]